uniref:Uncharacterized protein n=1 Tax=Strombidium rassoulzadegani TaxID=1082188 RepID=A0A7S3CJF9_9SPIT|mmetsp:Transcript_13167/g.22311  ORF Transcript_13167/g.22311 Transcript_13167/m.22311 type:complete len:188 (+) Transcript_13167:1291-1854(+)
MVMAVTCSFNYYLINFYVKYLPGNIFTNQIVNSVSESVAHGLSMVVLAMLSIKKGYLCSFFVCAFSALLVIGSESSGMDWLVPVCVLGVKASISIAFCFLYFSTVNYFPSAYLGFVMGFSNVAGRMSTIAAPMFAEQKDPIPMVSCIVLSVLSLACSLQLEQPEALRKAQRPGTEERGKELVELANM